MGYIEQMRRYSPGYYSPPRRGYSSRGRSPPRGGYSPPRRGYSPPRRGYGGGGGGGGGGAYGRRKQKGSLLVRNIPTDCRPEELRIPFERFGIVQDVYIPRDYYTKAPRGFAFVEFTDCEDALDAQYHLNGQIFAGREITVVLAAETRKKPDEMRRRTRERSSPRAGRRSQYRRSRSRSVSRSPAPRYRSGSRRDHRSRSLSGSPRRRDDHFASPVRRTVDRSRSPRASPLDDDGRRSISPKSEDQNELDNGKSKYEAEDTRDSPSRLSRSPSAEASPMRSR